MVKKKQGHAWRDSGAGFAPIPGEQRKLTNEFPQYQFVFRKTKIFVYPKGGMNPILSLEKCEDGGWKSRDKIFRTAAEAVASL